MVTPPGCSEVTPAASSVGTSAGGSVALLREVLWALLREVLWALQREVLWALLWSFHIMYVHSVRPQTARRNGNGGHGQVPAKKRLETLECQIKLHSKLTGSTGGPRGPLCKLVALPPAIEKNIMGQSNQIPSPNGPQG